MATAVSSWSSEHLLAELSRRNEAAVKPACGSGAKGSYNTSLHVFALILILVLSTFACGFPIISRRSSKSSEPNRYIFFSQHFGTGVLIATAFVHLLPTAFMSLTDPCLPYFFSSGYHPLAGLIAMCSALVVVGLEMFLTERGARQGHNHGGWEEEDAHGEQNGGSTGGHRKLGKLGMRRPKNIDTSATDSLMAGASPNPESEPMQNGTGHGIPGDTNGFAEDDDDSDKISDVDLDDLDPTTTRLQVPTTMAGPSEIESQKHVLSEEDSAKKQMLQCFLLEAGILFHSIFIGMAVSVATGPPFLVFLIAITFHQCFEGLALGSRIAAIKFSPKSPRPYLMVLAYGLTTPVGQAIGLIVHNLYDPQSAAGLLMVGFMNAISSGLLLFAGLVQLLAEDFLSDKSYGVLKGRRRWEAWASVCAGAGLMALVGAWA